MTRDDRVTLWICAISIFVGFAVAELYVYGDIGVKAEISPVSDQLLASRRANVLPYTDGVYAIWYDKDSVMQWVPFSDTVVWNADTLVHPLFVEGSVYWEARSPDTAWCYCPDSLGHYTVPCFFLLQRE